MDESDINIQIDLQGRTESIAKIDMLCQYLIAQKNFSVLAYEENGEIVAHGNGFDDGFAYTFTQVDELKALKDDFDRILIRTDGVSFIAYCIKNCMDSDMKVTTTLDTLRDIGKTCLTYTSTVNRTKMPVWFYIIEAGNKPQANTSNLKGLKCMPGKQRVSVRAFSLNFLTNTVWSNALFNGIFAGKRYFQNVLTSIAANQVIAYKPASDIKIQASTPLLTYIMLAVFTCVFIAELYASNSYLSPNNETLIAFGALSKSFVTQDREWYRIISAAFLHGSYMHILFNGIAFFISGMLIETLLGRSWLFTIFILSALGGGIASMVLNAPNSFTVGASGGVMGLIAASFMISFRLPYGAIRTNIQMRTLYMFVPAIIPLFSSIHGEKIDYAAHLGGSIVGFLLAFAIYRSWSKDSPEPSSMKFAKLLGILCALITVGASGQAAIKLRVYQQQFDIVGSLIPQSELDDLGKAKDESTDDQTALVNNLLTKYPNDPRSYYLQAILENGNSDYVIASNLLYKGLTKLDRVKMAFSDRMLETQIRLLLARSLISQSKSVDAVAAIQPVCDIVGPTNHQWVTAHWVDDACKK